MNDNIEHEGKWCISDRSMDGRPIVFDYKVVITGWEMVNLHLCEVFALITDSNLLMGLILVDVNAHLVDSLGVFVDASIDASTYAGKFEGQRKYHLLVRLLGCKDTLVFGNVRGLDLHFIPVVTVINHFLDLIEAHDE